MHKYNIEQGTQEWRNLRRSKICASDMPIILGQSEYMTRYQLWEIKTGLKEEEPPSTGMQLGHRYEHQIRQYAIDNFGYNFVPAVVSPDVHSIFLASLDGIDEQKHVILEAKLCRHEIFNMIKNNVCPPHFYIQIQVQLFCSNCESCLLVAYSITNNDYASMYIMKDETLFQEYNKEAQIFMAYIESLIAPDKIAKDFPLTQYNDVDDQILSVAYSQALSDLKKQEALVQELKTQILKRANGQSCIVGNFDVKKITKKGSTDWDALCDHYQIAEVEREKFTKPSSEYFKITELK